MGNKKNNIGDIETPNTSNNNEKTKEELKLIKQELLKRKQEEVTKKLETLRKKREKNKKELSKEEIEKNKKILEALEERQKEAERKLEEQKKLYEEEINNDSEINEKELEELYLEDDDFDDDFDDIIKEEKLINEEIEKKRVVRHFLHREIILIIEFLLNFKKWLKERKNLKIFLLFLSVIFYIIAIIVIDNKYLNIIDEINIQNEQNIKDFKKDIEKYKNKNYLKVNNIILDNKYNDFDNLVYFELKNYQYIINPYLMKIPYKYFYFTLIDDNIGTIKKIEDIFLLKKYINDNKDVNLYLNYINKNFILKKEIVNINLPENFKYENDRSDDIIDNKNYIKKDFTENIYLDKELINKIYFSFDNYNVLLTIEKEKKDILEVTFLLIFIMLLVPFYENIIQFIKFIFRTEEDEKTRLYKKGINFEETIDNTSLNIEKIEEEIIKKKIEMIENELSNIKNQNTKVLSYTKNINNGFINIFDISINGNKLSKIKNDISVEHLKELTKIIVNFAIKNDLIEDNYYIYLSKKLVNDNDFKIWLRERIFDYEYINLYFDYPITEHEKTQLKTYLKIKNINFIVDIKREDNEKN